MVLDASKFIPGNAKDKLPEFDDRCIDLVVTAPPGYMEKGDNTSGDTSYSWDTFDDYIDYMQDVFTEVYRMLKNLHYCIVVVGDENVICGGEHNIPKKYPLPAYYTLPLESIGFTYAGKCIWDKGCSKRSYRKNETPVYPFTVMPKQCCDHILIFQKSELNCEPIPCPCCGGTDVKPYGYTKKGLKNWKCDDPECPGKNEKGLGKVFNEGSILRKDVKSKMNAIPPEMLEKWHRNVVEIDTFTSCGRASRQRYLPVDIVEMAMRYFSGVGDYVLDPFSGLGTTVLTAIELKRKFLCIESDDKDIDIFLSNCTRLRRNMEMRLAEMETADP